MIVVTKHGNTYKEAICDNCKAELKYTDVDRKEFVTETMYGNIYTYTITCPECGMSIKVDEEDRRENLPKKKCFCVCCVDEFEYTSKDIKSIIDPKTGIAIKEFVECPDCGTKYYPEGDIL